MPRWPGPTSDGWEESTEGDLDPDLTEEAGYAWWDPPRRSWVPIALRVGMALALLALLATAVMPLLSGRAPRSTPPPTPAGGFVWQAP